jgi:hypothetical protein
MLFIICFNFFKTFKDLDNTCNLFSRLINVSIKKVIGSRLARLAHQAQLINGFVPVFIREYSNIWLTYR